MRVLIVVIWLLTTTAAFACGDTECGVECCIEVCECSEATLSCGINPNPEVAILLAQHPRLIITHEVKAPPKRGPQSFVLYWDLPSHIQAEPSKPPVPPPR